MRQETLPACAHPAQHRSDHCASGRAACRPTDALAGFSQGAHGPPTGLRTRACPGSWSCRLTYPAEPWRRGGRARPPRNPLMAHGTQTRHPARAWLPGPRPQRQPVHVDWREYRMPPRCARGFATSGVLRSAGRILKEGAGPPPNLPPRGPHGPPEPPPRGVKHGRQTPPHPGATAEARPPARQAGVRGTDPWRWRGNSSVRSEAMSETARTPKFIRDRDTTTWDHRGGGPGDPALSHRAQRYIHSTTPSQRPELVWRGSAGRTSASTTPTPPGGASTWSRSSGLRWLGVDGGEHSTTPPTT